MKIEIEAEVLYPGVDRPRQVSVTINGASIEDAEQYAETYFRGHIAEQLRVKVLYVTACEDDQQSRGGN